MIMIKFEQVGARTNDLQFSYLLENLNSTTNNQVLFILFYTDYIKFCLEFKELKILLLVCFTNQYLPTKYYMYFPTAEQGTI